MEPEGGRPGRGRSQGRGDLWSGGCKATALQYAPSRKLNFSELLGFRHLVPGEEKNRERQRGSMEAVAERLGEAVRLRSFRKKVG